MLVWLTVAPACDGATALLRALAVAVAVAVAVYLVLMPSLASGSSSPWFAPVHVVILMCHARAGAYYIVNGGNGTLINVAPADAHKRPLPDYPSAAVTMR